MLTLVEQAIHIKIGILVKIGGVEIYLLFLLILLLRLLLLFVFLTWGWLDHQPMRDETSLPLLPSQYFRVTEEQRSSLWLTILNQAIDMSWFILR